MSETPSTPATRARGAALASLAALALAALVSAMQTIAWPASAVLGVLYVAPLVLPVAGLARGVRRTYAWATLCVIPYFVIGITEAVANPRARPAAAAVLFLALALFVALVWFLRVTRPAPDRTSPSDPQARV